MINSVAGRRAIPSRSEYSASKFALAGFTEALRAELSKDGIFVCSMNPGLTESNFESNMIENTARRSLHAERSMTSDECGRLIWNGYRSGRIESTFTLKARSLILMNRFFPRLVDFLMCRFVKKLYAKDGARSMEAAASG
jgi:short-subunit dehydrogenase